MTIVLFDLELSELGCMLEYEQIKEIFRVFPKVWEVNQRLLVIFFITTFLFISITVRAMPSKRLHAPRFFLKYQLHNIEGPSSVRVMHAPRYDIE